MTAARPMRRHTLAGAGRPATAPDTHSGEIPLHGTVTAIRRYPVKSMLGEDVAFSDVGARGLAQDRTAALIDLRTGKVASAKNPRMWRGMLKIRATAAGPAIGIIFPGGKQMWSTDPGIDGMLSQLLGQPVTLATAPAAGATLDRARPDDVLRDGVDAPVAVDETRLGQGSPDGTFFDFAPVHLITTSTLDRIAELSPRGTVEPERYRPNIIIQTPGRGFTENDWVGRDLRIGTDVVLRVIGRTHRCAVPTLEHGGLPRDVAALRVPSEHNRVVPMDRLGPLPCAGVYAQVLRPGRIQVSDAAELA